jgi:signal transduction histidine kinase
LAFSTRTVDAVVEASVADNGLGIRAETQRQVFAPFFTTKPLGHGTGQGLAIVHAVAQEHGGSIDFQTELDRGSTFRFLIPASMPGSSR